MVCMIRLFQDQLAWAIQLEHVTLCILALVVIGPITLFLWMGIRYLLDVAGATTKTGPGTVVSRSYEPEFINFLVPEDTTTAGWNPRFYPAQYQVVIKVDEQEDCILVTHNVWDALANGSLVNVRYRIGRNSGRLYIDEFTY